jgi:glucose-6-phosphate 1-dehydrogenase
VLAGVLDGDPLLAVLGDTAVDCWRLIDPVLAAWRTGQTPLESYPARSEGPEGRRPEDRPNVAARRT